MPSQCVSKIAVTNALVITETSVDARVEKESWQKINLEMSRLTSLNKQLQRNRAQKCQRPSTAEGLMQRSGSSVTKLQVDSFP